MKIRTISIIRFVVPSISLLLLAPQVWAGRGTITGKEAVGWDTGYYNVVIGTIHDVQREPNQPPERHQARLVPRATIAGTFDCSLHPKLPVTFYIGDLTSSIAALPPEGATVIVLMQFLPADEDRQEVSGFIFSDICTCMPDKSGLVVIKSLDDPRVVDTLKRLQDARARPDPNPNVKPANKQPAADKR